MFFFVSCTGKSLDFSLVCLNFSPKTSLNFPFLPKMLSLVLKKTCVVFLESFVNFYRLTRAFNLKGIDKEVLYDHQCPKSKLPVTVLIYCFLCCVYNVPRSYCYFSCKYRRYQLQLVGFQCCSITKGAKEGHATILQPIL